MAEELEVLWKKLSFTEEETDDVELGSGSTKAAIERGRFCAVLKVLTSRSVSLDALRKNLRMMWKLKKEMKMSEIEEDLFLVEFGDEKDKKKVIDMSPWSYEKQLVIIQEFEAELIPKEIELKWSPFWVQIFNLPLKCRTRETGMAIGSKLGEVLEVDVPESGVHWGKCLRVRIRIDVTKRLLRGKRVSIEGGESRWVNFKYERLPNFCYSCGLLSHSLKECQDSSASVIQNKGELQYGAWMRGEPMRRGNRDFLNTGMEGGVAGGGDTGDRSEKERPQPAGTGAVGEASNTHVPRIEARGDDSLTWDETKVASSMHLTENLHGKGKVNLKEGKAKDLMAQTSVGATDGKAAQPEDSDEMQWDRSTRQVDDPTFKFENESVQSLKMHATSTDSANMSQSPVAMV